MTFSKLPAAIALFLSTIAYAPAALPPQAQRRAEFLAILDSPEVARALTPPSQSMAPLDAIEHTGPDRYEVRAGSCRATLHLVDDPKAPDMPGPRHFKIVVDQHRCN